MTEPKVRHTIPVDQDKESDFYKIFEDVHDETFFRTVSKVCGFTDEHRLAV